MDSAIISQRSVCYNGHQIDYQLEQKEVKNLNLRIRSDGSVYLSANHEVPLEDVDLFVAKKSEYILKAQEHFRDLNSYGAQPKNYVSGETFYIQGRGLRLKVRTVEKESAISDGVYIYLNVKDPSDVEKKKKLTERFLNQQCQEVFREVMQETFPLFKKYGVEMPTLRIRNMETRWGSCLPQKGIITLNKRLLEAPRNCIEYVVLHEFCHFIHPNHSKQFYNFVAMLMPDWKERKQTLDKCAEYWL